MHEIAAKMMGASRRVNAFDYLFVRRDNELVSIDDIRSKYREEYK
jgi:site-specific DNA-methyltransferase (adenine-specific)